MSNILDQEILILKGKTDEAVKTLHHLAFAIGSEELIQIVSDLRNRINEPFMFVIVGEVKSGKSSFINALLESTDPICEVGPQPITDTIQQILFGEKESVNVINAYLKKIFRPIDILKEIAIVDTPGTNSIIDQHQEITERFIPASDLIVFVFEAKNPYRQSAWEFFDYIHKDWQKKIIFVLQQKDLLDDKDLGTNLKGVVDQAIKKGIQNPNVFAVSAKIELESGDDHRSGFAEVREFVKNNITGGKAPVLKLQNNLQTSMNISKKIREGMDVRKAQLDADQHFRQDIQNTLDRQEEQIRHQVGSMTENIVAVYDNQTYKIEKELKDGLSFFTLVRRSIQSIFSKKTSAKEWLDELAKTLEHDLNDKLNSTLHSGVSDLANSIQQMVSIIDLKIKDNKTILKTNSELFSDIAERRKQVISELEGSFNEFLKRNENFTNKELFPDKQTLSPNIVTGSGIAIIGVVLTAVTNGMVFDITGGVLTAIGLLFAGISSGSKRRKIINTYQAEIAKGRIQIEKEVKGKLELYVSAIKEKIDGNFVDFDALLKDESAQIQKIENQYEQVKGELNELSEQINKYVIW